MRTPAAPARRAFPVAEPHAPPRAGALRRFFRTPKGLLTLVLSGLLVVAAAGAGVTLVAPGVLAAVVAAMLVDLPILRARDGAWTFPDGALLTGLIVAMVLSPHEPWYIAAVTSAVGVASKYVVRTHSANTFNPAALGLLATFYAFNSGQSWWGSLAELPSLAIVLLVVSGAWIADRVNKLPAVLSFLGSYYLLFTITAFIGDAARVAELYRAPDVHAALYFAFFMVTDPPTSPPRHRDQLVYGTITGVVAYAAFELVGAAWWLLGGVLVANVWEGWRRHRVRHRRAHQHAAA